MAWLSNMTRAQKEQYVIELYKHDNTSREIAERTHMSFCDIRVITDKVKAEVEREAGHINEQEIDNKAMSKASQAFKLFSEGKAPVDVVIALDLPTDEVRAIYREFWELKGIFHLTIHPKLHPPLVIPYILPIYSALLTTRIFFTGHRHSKRTSTSR
jgi:hypothetical protein